MRVLIVDDDPDIRLLVDMQLKFMSGIGSIDQAADGAQAIEIAARTQPDVIILDIDMPVMSGDQALPQLRAVAPRSTVIIHTAAPASAVADTIERADGYVQKGREDIAELVAHLLDVRNGQLASLA